MSSPGALVVVDEMSMVSTRQARDLLRIADRLGIARLALVGDQKQLRSVEAGQPFKQLQDAGMPTAYMDKIVRQRDAMLCEAVCDVIKGQPRAALDKLGDNLLEVSISELGETAAQIVAAAACRGARQHLNCGTYARAAAPHLGDGQGRTTH